jgi:signal transduction histidine kinase
MKDQGRRKNQPRSSFILQPSSFTDEGAIEVRAPATGEAATHLPWLSPGAAALVALARSPAALAWPEVRTDPGAVLLVVRHAPAAAPLITPRLLQDPAILEDAIYRLDRQDGCAVDWARTPARAVYAASLAYARLAERLAAASQRSDPDCAWAASLLAPLGWLALAAVDAEQVAGCLADAAFADDPVAVQQQRWGLDQAGIARRLCRRWGLPRWLAAVIGHLDLAPEMAPALGAPDGLFRVVQLAVALAQDEGSPLRLSVGGAIAENAAALGVSGAVLEAIIADHRSQNSDAELSCGDSPDRVPLLRELLALAIEHRRARDNPALERLEGDVDHLHQALREQRATEQERLRALKLAGLAEFAAGASHEINNPLAVISGQAQYLLAHEPDPSRQRSLQTIIGQAQRIHQVLSQLMQYARPPRPQPRAVQAAAVVQEVAASFAEFAAQKNVRLVCPPPDVALWVWADERLLHTALACLLRNAIEAAPADGWAGLRVVAESPEQVEFLAEDNGGGPAPAHREHLFDPFFSGRPAGRGRGLGLPTAWQLARVQGGDVYYA